jgi:recombination protein RecA
MQDDKRKAVDLALTQIERQYGKGAVMRLGDKPHVTVPVISSGALSIDHALGVGGVPRGRIIEIYGPESSGENDLSTAYYRRSPEGQRTRCICRCRARA